MLSRNMLIGAGLLAAAVVAIVIIAKRRAQRFASDTILDKMQKGWRESGFTSSQIDELTAVYHKKHAATSHRKYAFFAPKQARMQAIVDAWKDDGKKWYEPYGPQEWIKTQEVKAFLGGQSDSLFGVTIPIPSESSIEPKYIRRFTKWLKTEARDVICFGDMVAYLEGGFADDPIEDEVGTRTFDEVAKFSAPKKKAVKHKPQRLEDEYRLKKFEDYYTASFREGDEEERDEDDEEYYEEGVDIWEAYTKNPDSVEFYEKETIEHEIRKDAVISKDALEEVTLVLDEVGNDVEPKIDMRYTDLMDASDWAEAILDHGRYDNDLKNITNDLLDTKYLDEWLNGQCGGEALSYFINYYQPKDKNPETAIRCNLVPFTFYANRFSHSDGEFYLALGGSGMDLSPRWDAYQALCDGTIPANSQLFSRDNGSYFTGLVGKAMTAEVRAACLKDPVKSAANDALIEAAGKGDLVGVKTSLKNHASVHARLEAALSEAAFNGHLDVVEYLVGRGADTHIDDDRIFVSAAENGHLDVVTYLFGLGIGDAYRLSSAYEGAARNGHLDIVRYLIEHGVPIDGHNFGKAGQGRAIRWAAAIGHLDVVKYLVRRGAGNIDKAMEDVKEYMERVDKKEEKEKYNNLLAVMRFLEFGDGDVTMQSAGFVIPAWIKSDDGDRNEKFDALPWFKQASQKDIDALLKLANIDNFGALTGAAIDSYGGDYASDAIAYYIADSDAQVRGVIEHCEEMHAEGQDGGFEVYVDGTGVDSWLAKREESKREKEDITMMS